MLLLFCTPYTTVYKMEEERGGHYKKSLKLVKNDRLGRQLATLTEGSLPHAATFNIILNTSEYG